MKCKKITPGTGLMVYYEMQKNRPGTGLMVYYDMQKN